MEQFNGSFFPRCPVKESWQLFPRHLDTIHHLSKRGIVAYQIEPLSSASFHHPWCVFCVSTQEMFYVSFHELILSAQPSRRSIPVEFLSVVTMLDEDLESKDVKINLKQWINIFERDSWIMKIMLAMCPLCPLTSRLESRDEILV